MSHDSFTPTGAERADAAVAGWHALLHERFSSQPTPVVMFSDSVRSAASLWTGMRSWVHTFRAVGIGGGDRVVSDLSAGDALLQLALACLWESVGLVLGATAIDPAIDPAIDAAIDAAIDTEPLLAQHDARCLVSATRGGAYVLKPEAGGWPASTDMAWRARDRARDDRVLVPGFSDVGAAVPWCFAECFQAAQRSRAQGLLAHARVLTLCDWQQSASLWSGVLQPLLEVDELFLVHDCSDVVAVQQLLAQEPITHAVVDAGTLPAVRDVLTARGVPIVTVTGTHG